MDEQILEERDLGPHEKTTVVTSLLCEKYRVADVRVEVLVPPELKHRVICEEVFLKSGRVRSKVYRIDNRSDATVLMRTVAVLQNS
jgi:C4-type Zn-finger protein